MCHKPFFEKIIHYSSIIFALFGSSFSLFTCTPLTQQSPAIQLTAWHVNDWRCYCSDCIKKRCFLAYFQEQKLHRIAIITYISTVNKEKMSLLIFGLCSFKLSSKWKTTRFKLKTVRLTGVLLLNLISRVSKAFYKTEWQIGLQY